MNKQQNFTTAKTTKKKKPFTWNWKKMSEVLQDKRREQLKDRINS